MIIKVPIYVEFDVSLTPDQVADFSLLVRKEFLQVLRAGYKDGFKMDISFEKKKIKFKILSLGQVEERISSQH